MSFCIGAFQEGAGFCEIFASGAQRAAERISGPVVVATSLLVVSAVLVLATAALEKQYKQYKDTGSCDLLNYVKKTLFTPDAYLDSTDPQLITIGLGMNVANRTFNSSRLQ